MVTRAGSNHPLPWSTNGLLSWKMSAVHDVRTEARERPSRRTVDQLSPELRVEKYILLSMDGKLLGPELSRIRSEMALPLERLDADLPQDLPPGYLWRQRRSLPTFPLAPGSGAQTPADLRRSSDLLCAGQFPAGLSDLVTGMQAPASLCARSRGSPRARPRSALAAQASEAAGQGCRERTAPGREGGQE